MNWDHAVSWGRGSGLALAILVGLGRVSQPELKQSPQATRGKKKMCCAALTRKIWNESKKVSHKWRGEFKNIGLYSRFLKRFFAAVDLSQNCAGVFTGARKKLSFLVVVFNRSGLNRTQ